MPLKLSPSMLCRKISRRKALSTIGFIYGITATRECRKISRRKALSTCR